MRVLLFALLMAAADPWSSSDVLQPSEGAAQLASKPLILHVGFNVLYRAAHIPDSQYAGPASKAEGMELLKKAVAGQPKARPILLYCGCCPWEKCPNIRPAFAALHDLGFTDVKVLHIPDNLKADWIDKGFPTEKRAE